MLLRESGFTFDGKHSYGNFGFMYSEKDAGHQAMPAPVRNEYQIAGQSGSVLFPGETHQVMTFSGTLYPHDEPRTQMDAQARIRAVQAWLGSGRKKLIFDYEPDKYYLAQLTQRSQWSLKNWFGGQLDIAFEAQPYAYAVHESVFTSDATQGFIYMYPNMVTLQPAPAVIRITNLTGYETRWVNVNNGQFVFTPLSIAQNHYLEINSETPIGATFDGTDNALPYCTAFRPLMLNPGENTVLVTWDYSPSVRVEIRARGRW